MANEAQWSRRVPMAVLWSFLTLGMISTAEAQQHTMAVTGEIVVRTGEGDPPWLIIGVDEILDKNAAKVSMGSIDKLYFVRLDYPVFSSIETHLGLGRLTWFDDADREQVEVRALDGSYQLTMVSGNEVWISDTSTPRAEAYHEIHGLEGVSTYEGLKWSARELAAFEDLSLPDDLPRLFVPFAEAKALTIGNGWVDKAIEDCTEFNQPRDCSVTCDLGSCSCDCKLGFCGCCKCVGFGPVLETPMCLCGGC